MPSALFWTKSNNTNVPLEIEKPQKSPPHLKIAQQNMQHPQKCLHRNKHTSQHNIRFCVSSQRLYNVNGWRQTGNQGMDENADASIRTVSAWYPQIIEINDEVHLLFGHRSFYLSFNIYRSTCPEPVTKIVHIF